MGAACGWESGEEGFDNLVAIQFDGLGEREYRIGMRTEIGSGKAARTLNNVDMASCLHKRLTTEKALTSWSWRRSRMERFISGGRVLHPRDIWRGRVRGGGRVVIGEGSSDLVWRSYIGSWCGCRHGEGRCLVRFRRPWTIE